MSEVAQKNEWRSWIRSSSEHWQCLTFIHADDRVGWLDEWRLLVVGTTPRQHAHHNRTSAYNCGAEWAAERHLWKIPTTARLKRRIGTENPHNNAGRWVERLATDGGWEQIYRVHRRGATSVRNCFSGGWRLLLLTVRVADLGAVRSVLK